jgi:CheY-like chemotaxis protein
VRVLFVEDEQEGREILSIVLTRAGAEVLAVSTVREALSALDHFTPHVLVSDIGMPGEDGYGLLRQVRARPPEKGGRVPAAALTAYARSEDRMRALAAGFQTHVPKPINPGELIAVVSALARWTVGGGGEGARAAASP